MVHKHSRNGKHSFAGLDGVWMWAFNVHIYEMHWKLILLFLIRQTVGIASANFIVINLINIITTQELFWKISVQTLHPNISGKKLKRKIQPKQTLVMAKLSVLRKSVAMFPVEEVKTYCKPAQHHKGWFQQFPLLQRNFWRRFQILFLFLEQIWK